MNTLTKMTLTALTIATLTGCASVPLASPAEDDEAKKFLVTSDDASIYIYRTTYGPSSGGAWGMKTYIDGKYLGQSEAKTYMLVHVPAGKHVIKSICENTDTLEVNAIAGKPLYVWQKANFGIIKARTELILTNENEAKEEIMINHLIKQGLPEES